METIGRIQAKPPVAKPYLSSRAPGLRPKGGAVRKGQHEIGDACRVTQVRCVREARESDQLGVRENSRPTATHPTWRESVGRTPHQQHRADNACEVRK